MNRLFRSCFLPLFGFAVSMVPLEQDLQLTQIIALAMEHNPRLHARQEDLIASQEQIRISGSWPDPQVSLGWYQTPVETREGPQQSKIALRQAIPWPTRLLVERDQARLQTQSIELQWHQDQLNLIRQIKEDYAELEFLVLSQQILTHQLISLDQLVAVMEVRYQNAQTEHPDLIRLQIDLLMLQDQLASVTAYEPVLLTRLERLIGTTLPFKLQFSSADGSLPEPQFNPLNIDGNPLLVQMKLARDSAELAVLNSKLKTRPNLTFGVEYMELGGTDSDPLAGTLGFSLPIWWGRNQARIEKARAYARSQQYLYQDAEQDLAWRLQKKQNQLADTWRSLNLYHESMIPLARAHYNISETGYLAGNESYDDYQQSYRQLLNLTLEAGRIRADYRQALAQYEELVNPFYGELNEKQ